MYFIKVATICLAIIIVLKPADSAPSAKTEDQYLTYPHGSLNDECIRENHYSRAFVSRHPSKECCICLLGNDGPRTNCDCQVLCLLKREYRYDLRDLCCDC